MKPASADAGLIEKFVSKKTVWHGHVVNFRVDTVRLPNGKWVFDKLGRGGNIEGYK